MKVGPKQPMASKKRDDPAQSRAFIKKAKEIEADGDKSAAVEVLGRLAKMPPEPRVKAAKRRP